MKILAYDTETHRISPGCVAPRLVVGSFWGDAFPQGHLALREECLDILRTALLDRQTILVGANLPYDLVVPCAEDPSLLPLCFDLYDGGRARDILISQKMRDLASEGLDFVTHNGKRIKPRWSLAECMLRKFGIDRSESKKDVNAPRLNYHRVDGMPLDAWPEEYRKYSLQDAKDTYDLYTQHYADPIVDELRQVRYSWAFALMGAWGIRTDSAGIQTLKTRLGAEAQTLRSQIRTTGFFRADGTKDMKVITARVSSAYMGNPPLTEKMRVSTDETCLTESNDPDLVCLAACNKINTVLNKDIPQLESGAVWPITPRWNVLVETGRTSVSPNVQNPPRKGGIRECHVPRPGFVYVFTDLDTIELRALAQACLNLIGWSRMAEALQRNEDLHSALAADILGMSYQEFCIAHKGGDVKCEEYRQFAKIPNFGLPGGLGLDSLVSWAKGSGIDISRDFAAGLILAWKRKWPEMELYFKHINAITSAWSDCTLTQLYSGRVRANVSYCSAANSYFQGLTADGAKSAVSACSRAMYVDRKSPLYGSRLVLFVHDELISEVPEWRLHAAAEEQRRILVAEVQEWMPDIPVSSTAVASRRWYKGAKQVLQNGILVPSKPLKQDGRTLWVADV